MHAVYAHEHEHAGDLMLACAEIKHDHAVRRLPTDGVVNAAGICTAEVELARRKLIGPRQQVSHGVLSLHHDHRGCDMQQRGGYRAE